MDEKTADPRCLLDVDILILDYLIHDALRRLLDEARQKGALAETNATNDAISMLDGQSMLSLLTDMATHWLLRLSSHLPSQPQINRD